MVGVGGQGILLASDILSLAALRAGFDVKKSEVHGMSQRGGSVFSHVRFGEKIHSPLISKGEADILLALEMMEALRWLDYVNPKSRLIVANTKIVPAGVAEYPAGVEAEVKQIFPDALMMNTEEVTKQTGHARFVNVAMVGVISQFVAFPEAAWKEAIEELVPKGTFEKNISAFQLGRGLKNK